MSNGCQQVLKTIIILTEMQFSVENLQTVRRHKKVIQNLRSRSVDLLPLQELSPRQTKLLLSVPKQLSTSTIGTAIMKQELLVSKKLFDPFRYFGCPNFQTYQDSQHYHRRNFEEMFAPTEILTERKAVKKPLQEIRTFRKQQESPMAHFKASGLSTEKTRRTVARSPKSYVKQNKQNYQRLNINNMQKVRVKLKLTKK